MVQLVAHVILTPEAAAAVRPTPHAAASPGICGADGEDRSMEEASGVASIGASSANGDDGGMGDASGEGDDGGSGAAGEVNLYQTHPEDNIRANGTFQKWTPLGMLPESGSIH